MKKTILVIFSIALNFILFYFLSAYDFLSVSYEEVTMMLISASILIPLMCFLPSGIKYAADLRLRKPLVSFKNIYKDILFKSYMLIFSIMILIALMIYFKIS